MSVKRTKIIAAALGATAALAAPVGTAAAAASPARTVSVVAAGLNNPRGLTWAHGRLYLAEAGTAGTDCPKGEIGPAHGQVCYGRTGSLDTIVGGVVHRIRTGLLSTSDIPGGLGAEGIAAVTPLSTGVGVLYGGSVVGQLGALPPGTSLTPADNAALRQQSGRFDVVSGSREKQIADFGDSNFTFSAVHQNLVPDQFPDANPNALVQLADTTYVVDAATNVLSSLDALGRIHQLAFFPNAGRSDAVPTCIAKGPDRALYVGQLAPGAASGQGRIYRYSLVTRRLSVWKTGFNVVDGCGFDAAGNFYAVEFQAHGFNPSPAGNPAGDIVEIAKGGARSVLGAGQLFYPQGFAIDPVGNLYVSNWSILTGTPMAPGRPTGQVVRISR